MKFVIKSLPILAVIFLFASSVFTAESAHLFIKPSSDQPKQVDSNEGEISPFIKMNMEVSPKSGKTAIIRNMIVEINNVSEISPTVNRVVATLNKSPGVDRLEVGRIVANGFLSEGGKSVYLYPVHGDAIFSLKEEVTVTVAVVMNPDLEKESGKKISILATNIFASWVNGSQVPIEGYIPIVSDFKVIKSGPNIGIVNEEEAPYGALKYSVPIDSSEGMKIKKVFIYGKRENLKLLVQVDGGKGRKFRCKNNSYITSCDFRGKGIIIPKGSSVTVIASESGIFYPGFNTLDVFCEGEDSGRRIFVNPISFDGKG